MKLSIIIPVYNEEQSIKKIIEEIRKVNVNKELIIVDDGSDDRSKQILQKLKDESTTILTHSTNKGKGAAIRTALKYVNGDLVIIQDADLEYDPRDYIKLIKVSVEKNANVVYGSRFMDKKKATSRWHYLINCFLTFLVNILFKTHLTDTETCYKLFRSDVIKGINLKSNGFEFEPEVTIKVLKRGYYIYEVPIEYKSRFYHEGKKINWLDGLKTLYTILRYKIRD